MRRRVEYNQEVINNNAGDKSAATRSAIKMGFSAVPVVGAALALGEFGGNAVEKIGGDNETTSFLASSLDPARDIDYFANKQEAGEMEGSDYAKFASSFLIPGLGGVWKNRDEKDKKISSLLEDSKEVNIDMGQVNVNAGKIRGEASESVKTTTVNDIDFLDNNANLTAGAINAAASIYGAKGSFKGPSVDSEIDLSEDAQPNIENADAVEFTGVRANASYNEDLGDAANSSVDDLGNIVDPISNDEFLDNAVEPAWMNPGQENDMGVYNSWENSGPINTNSSIMGRTGVTNDPSIVLPNQGIAPPKTDPSFTSRAPLNNNIPIMRADNSRIINPNIGARIWNPNIKKKKKEIDLYGDSEGLEFDFNRNYGY